MLRSLIFAAAFIAAPASGESELNRLPLHTHVPGQKILMLPGNHERDVMTKHFAAIAHEIDYAEELDFEGTDFSRYYTIIMGSNKVDQFRGKEAEVFRPMIEFVENGGHLFFCGSFNGRNFHVAEPLGLKTNANHANGFVPIPNRTDALFFGHEDQVPEDRNLRSFGHLGVTRNHVSMLMKNDGYRKFATWSYGRGRVSATMVEPSASGLWFLPVIVDWVRRGAPTTIEDLVDRPAEVDPITLLQSQTSNAMIIGTTDRNRIQGELDATIAKLDPAERSQPDFAMELARDEEDGLKKSVALQMAAGLAADNAEAALAVALIEEAASWSYVELPKAKVELLERALEASNATSAGGVAEAALEEIAWFESLYLYDLAQDVSRVASQAAEKSENDDFAALSFEHLKRVVEKRIAMEANEELLANWKESPADPALLTKVGRFLTFAMDDWELGLDCLSKCDNLELQDLANGSMNLPQEPTLVIRLGDRWREFAKTCSSAERASIHAYVRSIYRDLGDDLRSVSTADRRRANDFLDAAPTVKDDFTVKLTLDGYGLLTITRQSATWETVSGLEPKSIEIGGHRWKPVNKPFANKASSRFISPEVDFRTARIADMSGRGIYRFVERTNNHVVLRINDLQVGESDYKVTLQFGE